MHASRTLVSLFAVALVACSAAPPDPGSGSEESASGKRNPIVGGTPATDYPEAVLVDMYQGGYPSAYCSGALIAPQLVLTAGHCVDGFDGFKVTSPYGGGDAYGSSSAVYDYNSSSDYVDPDLHDVGVIFLDSPIDIPAYPSIAQTPLVDGDKMVNIGRIQDGNLSTTSIFVSDPIAVEDGKSWGYPYDYVCAEIIESGDSGGPDMIPGSPHVIVSVNSGAGGGTEVLARVDLVFDWLQEQIGKSGSGGNPNPPPDPNDPQDPNDPGGDPGGQDQCGGIDYVGQCKGDELAWCESGYLIEVDCAAYGLSCGYDDWSGLYDCLWY